MQKDLSKWINVREIKIDNEVAKEISKSIIEE
jgi:hypothetical protein